MVSLLASLTACGPTLEMRPEAETLAPTVSVVVSMPTSVDFGGPGDQRRLQRRVGDRLLELTGGKVVVAEERPRATTTPACGRLSPRSARTRRRP